jgi:TP901 family phage tail tape measure protein
MADVQSNIKVSIDTTEALAQLKALQRQISAFHTSMAKTGAAGAAVSANMSQNLVNTINSSGKFYAEMTRIRTTSEAFNTALAKNQLSMKEYFRYSGAATKTFGRLFAQEHATINKVARENVKTLQTQYIKMGRDASGALKGISVRPLALDMNNLQTQTAMAAQKQALLNQLLRQGSTNLLNFGKNTQWAGRQLMVGFTVPLMYFGAMASKTFMQLEEQAIRFKRVYGDMFTSSSDTAKALKDVQLLANTFTQYGVAVADTMKMAADVAATGKVGADLLAQVSNATRLAVLGGIDQQKSLDTIISLTSTFGIASKDLADNINFLNAVENQTILNIDDLTTAIPKAAPVIKQLGGDVKDLAFFMTAMREGGINAAEGANALKSGLANMINPTKAARQMLAGFGIDIVGIVNADKGNVKKMVVDLATALDALDPLNRAQAIEKMFGKFQFARISTLFQNVIRDGSQAKTVLGLTNSTAQELAILSERELSKISDSPMYKFKKEIQDLKTSLAPIGGEFLKALTPIVKFFGDIFKSFNGLGDGTKKFIVILTTVLAGIGPLVLMSFGLLANAVANIIKLFVGIKSIFNGAGKASVGLGEQTSFLTQEQMQNAAAAASLDQAHQKLQQRFTSEAAAVRLLTQAYEQSVIAQRAFSASGVIGRTPGMKLSTGIVSVPGPKGAGDIVPAMLSPGEAVVPAKNVAKYPAFTSALVTGSIAGHMAGTAPAFAHAALPFAQGSAQYMQGIRIAGLEQLAQQFPQFIRVVSNLVAELPQKLNVAMQKGTAKAADFQKAWDARSGKFSTAAKLGGMDMSNPKLTAALAKLEVEVGKRTLSLAQASAIEKDVALGLQQGTSKVVVSDELFAKATNQVIEEFQLLDQSSRTASTALRAASP